MQAAGLWQDIMKVSAALLGPVIVVMTLLLGFKSLQRDEASGLMIMSVGGLLIFASVLFYSIWVVSDWATMARLDQMVLLYLILGIGLLVLVLLALVIMWHRASDV